MKSTYIAGHDGEDAGVQAGGLPDWRELVTIVIERIWYGIAIALIVLLFFVLQIMRQVPYYRSTATLMLDIDQPRILPIQDVAASSVRSLEYFNTVINILHSRQMMEAALQYAGLDTHPNFFPHVEGLSAKASAALRLVRIDPVDRSRLIRVTVEHTDPQLASDLANAMAQAYIQQEVDNRMGVSLQASEWLLERSIDYRERLEAGMHALQQYREEAQSVSLEEDQNIVIAKLKSLNSALSAAQTERIAKQSKWEAISRQIDAEVPRGRIAPQLGDAVLADAQAQLQRHRQRMALLRERYRDDHPDMREALQQEAHLERLFDDVFETAVYALQNRYETLRAKEANLRTALQEQEQEAFQLARQLVQYEDLRRMVEAERQIYDSIISRMKETDISQDMPNERMRLVERAQPAGAPFRPNPRRELMRGGVVAGFAGFGMIFLLYYADHRLRRTEEVERSLGVPVLISLPIVRGKTMQERGMVSFEHPTGDVSEGFRTLRAILEMNPVVEKSKVMLITSSHPAEGKSLVSINLAFCYAQNSCRTLLIGGDLRRPSLHKIFPDLKRDGGGLARALKEGHWEYLVTSGICENLDVLEAGHSEDRPSEMLSGSAFSRILSEMREKYDKIIIDAPPILGVSDSLILLKQTEAVLFVVRYGKTHSMGARQSIRRIESSGAPCVGAVMNGVDLHSLANYYYYRSYGGYSYQSYLNAGGQASRKAESGPGTFRGRKKTV